VPKRAPGDTRANPQSHASHAQGMGYRADQDRHVVAPCAKAGETPMYLQDIWSFGGMPGPRTKTMKSADKHEAPYPGWYPGIPGGNTHASRNDAKENRAPNRAPNQSNGNGFGGKLANEGPDHLVQPDGDPSWEALFDFLRPDQALEPAPISKGAHDVSSGRSWENQMVRGR
jgi:hypothetical protein